MASSQEKLVDAIDKSSFKLTVQEFKQEKDIILRKSVYLYEYIDSQERFKETYYYQKRHSIVSYRIKLSAQTNMIMHNQYGSHLNVKHYAITMTCT